MRILIADTLSPAVAAGLAARGLAAHTDPTLSGASLEAALAARNPEVLVVRSTPVARAQLEAANGLSLVIRAGAGVNTIDLDSASGRGIYVANCPGKNAAAVAELTIGHLVNLDRRIVDNALALRDGEWNKKRFGGARGLQGRTLAIIGFGQIGRAVAERARAMGMRIVAWSRSLDAARAEEAGVAHAESLEAAVSDADAVTVHLGLSDSTRGIIGPSVFAAMRDGAYFINTSRGPVVDQGALVRAVSEKGIRAGLDVFRDEPASGTAAFEDPIASLPGVYGTHHIGASTQQAEDAVGEEVLRIIDAYGSGQVIPNCVNLAVRSPATHRLVVRHIDRVGVLAGVLDVLRGAGHNVQEMENIVFGGAAAACARISMVGAPSEETLARIEGDASVFSASVTSLAH
jgi:D-3-phosphoglycerate dehydrogenase